MTPGKVNASETTSASSSQPADGSQKDDTNLEISEIKNCFVACEPVTIEKNEQIAAAGKKPKTNDDKIKSETMEEELLGSLTSMSSPAVRTSARVIQKMKMDSIRPTTPPPMDKKEMSKDDHHHHRNAQKTPNQTRPSKTIWSNVERNLFFDALNEYGKDFESIAHYINGKQKRKNASDPTYKAKEHVRLLYFQTFTKISKYLRFSDDVKRTVQELYALINYGEMRKKIPIDNQKFFMKLRELVYRGSVTWRVKGKNCRIKTPSCAALRKINQVEKWQEDIKLPTKVDVELKPADNESWYNVQSLAQNPRVKTSLPLQKRLISLIKTLQAKWRCREARLFDQANAIISSNGPKINQATPSSSLASTGLAITSTASTSSPPANPLASKLLTENASNEMSNNLPHTQMPSYVEPLLCITPSLDAVIHRPYVNLTDFLNSYSICLNSYEERIEATVRGETLCAEYITNFKEMIKSNAKRQRHDSGSEKKSPDMKRTKGSEIDPKPLIEHDVIKKATTSSSQDGMSSTSVDESTGTHDDKFDRDFASPTYENAMFEIDGVSQIVESTSADEGDRDDIVKLKSEQRDECLATTELGINVKKEQSDPAQLSDCIKRGLSTSSKASKRNEQKSNLNMSKKRSELRTNSREAYRPLINDEVIQKIRKGWTIFDVGDITIGDLYIMFGQDSKVRLEYKWVAAPQQIDGKSDVIGMSQINDTAAACDGKECSEEEIKTEHVANAANTSKSDDVEFKPFGAAENKPQNALSNKLKQLLMLANMTEKTKRKSSCSCGHYCDRNLNKVKKDEIFPRSFISNKTYPSSHTDNTLFRQPVLPSRSGMTHFEAYRLNINTSRNKQNRWQKPRNNRSSKQVVVQRLLPLQPGITQTYGVLTTADMNYSNSNVEHTIINAPKSSLEINSASFTSDNLQLINTQAKNMESSTTTIDSGHKPQPPATDISKLLEFDDDNEFDVNDDDANEIEKISSMGDTMLCTRYEMDDDIENDDEIDDETYRIRQQLNDDPGIQSLMEISLPSPIPIASSTDEYFTDSSSQPPMSPMGILRESPSPANAKWFAENMNEFSCSSFLGHLDSTCEQSTSGRRSQSPNCSIDNSNLSTISETSIDMMTKFMEITESMKNQGNDIIMQ